MAPPIKKRQPVPFNEQHVPFDAGSTRQCIAAGKRADIRRKRVLRTIRELGFQNEREALQLILISMLAGYDQAIATLPEKSMSRLMVVGAFGASPTLARQLLRGE